MDEAIAECREAIRLKPDDPLAHGNLGNALYGQGKLGEAIAEYREAVRLKADFPEAHNNLGSALKKQGMLDEAITACREAIRLKPDDPGYHYNLGNALSAQGKTDEAIAECREAIRLKHDYPEAHTNLGSDLAEQGKLDEAIAHYHEALQITPFRQAYIAHRNLGDALRQQGKLDEAIAEYREAIRLQPTDPKLHNNLAWFLATAADPKWRAPSEAVELALKAVELSPMGMHWNTLGVAHYRNGQWTEALDALQKSMDLSDGGLAYDGLFLAMAHWQLGHKEEAHRHYDKSVELIAKNQPADEELKRFRAEAAELLGIAGEPDQTDASGASDKNEKPPTEKSEEKSKLEVKQNKNES